jgi:hypothetical protein
MYEDAHLEMAYEDRFRFEDETDWNEQDFDSLEVFFDEDGCEGHYDDDHALTSGNSIGEPYYCDGSCM